MTEEHTPAAPTRLPHDPDLERSVLAGCLLDEEFRVHAIQALEPEMFYLESHRILFTAISSLVNSDDAVDGLSLTNKLRSLGKLEFVGGASYISSIESYTPDITQPKTHAKQLRDHHLSRELLRVAMQAQARVAAGDTDIAKTIAQVQDELSVLTSPEDHLVAFDEALDAVARRGLSYALDKHVDKGWTVGLPNLDQALCGLRSKNVYVISGPTGGGKTSLALQIALVIAKQGASLLFVTREMDAIQLAERAQAAATAIPVNMIRTGQHLSLHNAQRMCEAADNLKGTIMFVDEHSVTPGAIRARVRQLQLTKGGLHGVFVDYMQLLQGSKQRYGSRQEEVQDVSRALKSTAMDLDVAVVLVSQLNEQGELRESRAIEHDATAVIQITRKRDSSDALVEVRKNRFGPVAIGEGQGILVRFEGHYTRFKEISKERKQAAPDNPEPPPW